jgi:hypothetical protein
MNKKNLTMIQIDAEDRKYVKLYAIEKNISIAQAIKELIRKDKKGVFSKEIDMKW